MAINWDAAVVEFDAATQGDGTGTAYLLRGSFTATNATNMLTMADHQFQTGDLLRLVGSDLPDGLTADTDYYAIYSTDDDFQVALTNALAVAGTAVTFADDGSGTRQVSMLPAHNHKLYIDHFAIRSGATGGAILVHDALNGKILIDIPSMATNDAVWWDAKYFAHGIYISTLPATCKVYAHYGQPAGVGAGRSL